jgi:hypothetical protein
LVPCTLIWTQHCNKRRENNQKRSCHNTPITNISAYTRSLVCNATVAASAARGCLLVHFVMSKHHRSMRYQSLLDECTALHHCRLYSPPRRLRIPNESSETSNNTWVTTQILLLPYLKPR